MINLNINYKNKRSQKNYNKNTYNNNNNYLIGLYKNNNLLNKYKYNLQKNKNVRSFSSSANRFFTSAHLPYYSYKSLDRNHIYKKDKNLIKRDNNKKKLSSSKNNTKKNNSNLSNLITNCNLLKEKAYNVLSNYISLTEYIINNKKESK